MNYLVVALTVTKMVKDELAYIVFQVSEVTGVLERKKWFAIH